MKRLKPKAWPTPAVEFAVPVFPGYVYLYRNKKRYVRACKYFKIEHDKSEIATWHGTHQMLVHKGRSIHLMGHFDEKPSTLVHEAAHLCSRVLQHAEVPVTSESEEVYCYLLAELLKQLGLDDWEYPIEPL